MKLSLLATMAATANAQCRTSYTDSTEPANCACNAACTRCVGAENDTAATALASNCQTGTCTDMTPYFTSKSDAQPHMGTCGNAVCEEAVEKIAGVDRKTPCVAPLIGTAADGIDYSAETIKGTRGTKGYRGRQNKTKTGKKCQAWNVNAPAENTHTPDLKPLNGMESNFCRASGYDYIWCNIDEVGASPDWEKCDPLVKPPCKGIEDCYETEFAEGCCAEMTVSAGYAPTDAQKKYGGTTSLWNDKAPEVGAKATRCVSKGAAAEYAGALTTGTAFTSNMSVALENIRKGDGGKLNGVDVADLAALWTLFKTDAATQEALIVDLTCLKTAESAMKVAVSATVALITVALI